MKVFMVGFKIISLDAELLEFSPVLTNVAYTTEETIPMILCI